MAENDSVKVNSRDYEAIWPGHRIFHLIISTNDYIVYVDPEYDIDWSTKDHYDKNYIGDEKRHYEIINRVASLECIPNEHQKKSIRLNFKRMIGEGIARSLKHDYDNAHKILDKAFEYIKERNVEKARFWQLSAVNVTGLSIGIFGIILWCFRNYLIAQLGETAVFCLLAFSAGAVGATLSYILRIGNIQVTSEAERKLHILEAVSRVFAGAISGLIVSLLIRLGILIPVIGMVQETYVAMVAGGFIAGLSERWVPSLVAKFEDHKNGERNG